MCVCVEALKEVTEITAQLQSSLIRLENFQKLTELQRDLIGIENLTAPGRVRVMFSLMCEHPSLIFVEILFRKITAAFIDLK